MVPEFCILSQRWDKINELFKKVGMLTKSCICFIFVTLLPARKFTKHCTAQFCVSDLSPNLVFLPACRSGEPHLRDFRPSASMTTQGGGPTRAPLPPHFTPPQ